MIINNISKAVKVLKAVGLPALRLFPGHNELPSEHAEKYFDNPAARGMVKECLFPVEGDSLDHEEKKQIASAKKKNADLNKAKKIVQVQTKKIEEKESLIDEQKNVINAQVKEMKAQATKYDELKAESDGQADQITELMKAVEKLQKKDKPKKDK